MLIRVPDALHLSDVRFAATALFGDRAFRLMPPHPTRTLLDDAHAQRRVWKERSAMPVAIARRQVVHGFEGGQRPAA